MIDFKRRPGSSTGQSVPLLSGSTQLKYQKLNTCYFPPNRFFHHLQSITYNVIFHLLFCILLTACAPTLTIKGLYHHPTKTIYLADTVDLDSPVGICILEHEKVHHRQYYPASNTEPDIEIVSQEVILGIVDIASFEKRAYPNIYRNYECKNQLELEAYAAENVCRLKYGLQPIRDEFIRKVSQCR